MMPASPTTVELPAPSPVACSDLLSVRLTHLDLFSGIGGFALAAQAAGFTTIGFSEIEPYACKILKRHWPTVPNYGDIKNVRGIHADLVTGGFPCQPFSTAGKRRGASDDRALWPEMLRVIADAKPAWVLGENVPGIVSMELDRVLDDLEHLGYSAWPLAIPACAVDAHHRRERIWIVAYSESSRRKQSPPKSDPSTSGGQSGNGFSGGGSSLADATRRGTRPIQQRGQWSGPEPSGEILADAGSGRQPEREYLLQDRGEPTRSDANGRDQAGSCGDDADTNGDSAERSAIPRGECHLWQPEPGMGRVVDGVSNRAHRLRGLGNAIVPQVAETLIREMARTLNDQAEPSARSKTI